MVTDALLRITERCVQMVDVLNELKGRTNAEDSATITGLLAAVRLSCQLVALE